MFDWLDDLTNWFKDAFNSLWDALVEFFTDMIVMVMDAVLEFAALVIESIPVPAWLQQYSLDSLLGNAGPSIAWAISTFRIGEGLTIIAAAYAFRLLRKALTLGQW